MKMQLARAVATVGLGACMPLLLIFGQDPVAPPAPEKPAPEKSAPEKPALEKRERPKPPPRPGVNTPGVKREISTVRPTAVFAVAGTPDWQVVTDDAVWVSNGPKNTIHRLDPRTNQVAATVEVGKLPCSGLAAGFGSVWVPVCGDKVLARVDARTNHVTTTIPVGPANSEGGLIASPEAIWMLTDPKGTLARIDPATNKVAAEIAVAPGSVACVYGAGSVWVSSPEKSVVTRVDAKTNAVLATIAVGPAPRFLTWGAGSVWTLNQGDGTISRVDGKTGRLVANIEAGVPGTGGELAFGEGFVWATVFQIPLSKIDPANNRVVKQWTGPGGDSVRVGHGSLWLSNLREQNVWRIDLKVL